MLPIESPLRRGSRGAPGVPMKGTRMPGNAKAGSQGISRRGTTAACGLLLLAGTVGDRPAKDGAKPEAPQGTVVAVALHAREKTAIAGAEVTIAGVTGRQTTDSTGVAVVHGVPIGRRSVAIWATELIPGQYPASGRKGLPNLSVEYQAKRRVVVRAGKSDTLVFRLKPSRPVPVTWQWEP